jgi:hypothetical protein
LPQLTDDGQVAGSLDILQVDFLPCFGLMRIHFNSICSDPEAAMKLTRPPR